MANPYVYQTKSPLTGKVNPKHDVGLPIPFRERLAYSDVRFQDVYCTGDVVQIKATFDEPIHATGPPIELDGRRCREGSRYKSTPIKVLTLRRKEI